MRLYQLRKLPASKCVSMRIDELAMRLEQLRAGLKERALDEVAPMAAKAVMREETQNRRETSERKAGTITGKMRRFLKEVPEIRERIRAYRDGQSYLVVSEYGERVDEQQIEDCKRQLEEGMKAIIIQAL